MYIKLWFPSVDEHVALKTVIGILEIVIRAVYECFVCLVNSNRNLLILHVQ